MKSEISKNVFLSTSPTNFDVSYDTQFYNIIGAITLSGAYVIESVGTPVLGMSLLMFYNGVEMVTNNHPVTIFGYTLNDTQAKSYLLLVSYFDGSEWQTRVMFDVMNDSWITKEMFKTVTDDTTIQVGAGGLKVKDAGLTNLHFAAAAGIALTKLAASTPAVVMINDVSGFPVPSATTAAELGYLHGASLGVAVANAVLALGANKNVDTLAIQTLKLGAGAGTPITATAAEINVLAGILATVAELNLVHGLTASTSELNILHGVTATAAELNVLDGITATTAELNKLHGMIASAAEMNYLSGITSNIQTQLNNALAGNILTNATYTASTLLTGVTIKGVGIIDSSGGAWAITLPAAASVTAGFVAEFIRKGANSPTIAKSAVAGSVLLDKVGSDVAALTLATNGSSVRLISDGNLTWSVIQWIAV